VTEIDLDILDKNCFSLCYWINFIIGKCFCCRENYLFLCQCNRCVTEASEPDETSEEESEDEMDED